MFGPFYIRNFYKAQNFSCDKKTWHDKIVMTRKLGKESDNMNREEILRRSRNEHSEDFLDEREQYEALKSYGFGGVVTAILCVIFAIVNYLRGQSYYEFGVILFVYLASTSWKAYISTKKKYFMFLGISGIVGSIASLIGYLLQV